MKGFFFCLLLFGCIACTEKKAAPGKARPRLISKDSTSVTAPVYNPYVPVDLSPMDMSYLPVDYPKLSVRTRQPVARVLYSRPHKQGRKIFGKLLKYGDPWRLGANEATEIEFFIPVTIQNKRVAKGRYVLYCIPSKTEWTMVLNTNLNSWGLDINPEKDVFRFNIPAVRKDQSVEYFSMVFERTVSGADLVIAWDDIEARLPIQYKED